MPILDYENQLDSIPVDQLVLALQRRNFKVSIMPRKCIIEDVTLRLENHTPEGGAILLPLLDYQNLTILEGKKVVITVELDETNGDSADARITESSP